MPCARREGGMDRRAFLILLLLSCGGAGADRDAGPDAPEAMNISVLSLAFEPQGTALWVGTSHGAWRVDLRGGGQRRFGVEDGLASSAVVAILAASDGSVYMAHGMEQCGQGGCGVSRLLPDGKVVHLGEGLVDSRVIALAESPSGQVWLGTQSGAVRLDGPYTWTDFHDCKRSGSHCKPLWSYRVAGIAFGPDGSAYFAVDIQQIGVSPKPGGVARLSPDGLTDTWDSSDGLPANEAKAITVANGVVFAASSFGVARLSGDRWQQVLDSEWTSLAASPDGVWAVGPSGAVLVDITGKVRPFTEGLPSPQVRQVATYGTLACFGTAAGLACLDSRTGEWLRPM